MQAQQIPVTYVYTQTNSIRPNYAGKCSKILGIIQIVCGASLFILQVVSIIINAGWYFVGHGIWAGVFMVIAGAFGIASGSVKSLCLIITHMVMSIIAATFATIPLSLSAAVIPTEGDNYYYYSNSDSAGRVTVDAFMLVMSLVEIVAAIWASVLCCQVCCCPSTAPGVMPPPEQVQIQYVPAQAGGMQPVMIIPAGTSGGPMQVQAQAIPQQNMYPGPPPQAHTMAMAGATSGPGRRGEDSPPPAYTGTAPPMETKHPHGPN